MTTLKAEDKKFIIDQLRKDQIVYGTQAAAINLFCWLIIMGAPIIGNAFWMNVVAGAAFIFAILFTIFMGLGTIVRSRKIGRLQKDLGISI